MRAGGSEHVSVYLYVYACVCVYVCVVCPRVVRMYVRLSKDRMDVLVRDFVNQNYSHILLHTRVSGCMHVIYIQHTQYSPTPIATIRTLVLVRACVSRVFSASGQRA